MFFLFAAMVKKLLKGQCSLWNIKMRRSGAPSQFNPAKRPRFAVPFKDDSRGTGVGLNQTLQVKKARNRIVNINIFYHVNMVWSYCKTLNARWKSSNHIQIILNYFMCRSGQDIEHRFFNLFPNWDEGVAHECRMVGTVGNIWFLWTVRIFFHLILGWYPILGIE